MHRPALRDLRLGRRLLCFGSGFRVFRFRVLSVGFRVLMFGENQAPPVLQIRIQDRSLRFSVFGFRFLFGPRFRISGLDSVFDFRFSGFGYRVSGAEFRTKARCA